MPNRYLLLKLKHERKVAIFFLNNYINNITIFITLRITFGLNNKPQGGKLGIIKSSHKNGI